MNIDLYDFGLSAQYFLYVHFVPIHVSSRVFNHVLKRYRGKYNFHDHLIANGCVEVFHYECGKRNIGFILQVGSMFAPEWFSHE